MLVEGLFLFKFSTELVGAQQCMMVMFRPFDVNLAVMILSETGSHSIRLFAASFERSSPTPCVCASSSLSFPEYK